MQLILKNKFFNVTYLFALSLITIGIICSKALMSIGMVLGGVSLLLEFDFKEYYAKWKSNRLLHLLVLLYLWFVISLLWSQNIDYALEDLKSKLTLIVIPLLVFSKPELVCRNKDYLLIFIFDWYFYHFINKRSFLFSCSWRYRL